MQPLHSTSILRSMKKIRFRGLAVLVVSCTVLSFLLARYLPLRRRLPELPIPKYEQEQCIMDSFHPPMISKPDLFARLGEGLSPRKQCKCEGQSSPYSLPDMFVESCCSDEATLLGENQRVITFSLYFKSEETWNETKTKYFDGIMDNLRLMKQIYPGWVMRVYTNTSFTPEVCSVVCSDESIYFCDSLSLPQLGDVTNIDPRMWRYLAIGDPTVKLFASRDLDSRLSEREKDAVDQWEDSGYPVHAMRESPMHNTEIMAGMWGASNDKLCLPVARDIQRNITNWSAGGTDQTIATSVLYEPHKKKILIHDSFLCEEYKDSVPFPSQRPNDWFHVGRPHGETEPMHTECPVACRPTYGKDWKYC